MIQARREGLGFRKTMDKGILTARCLQTVIVFILLGPADSLSELGLEIKTLPQGIAFTCWYMSCGTLQCASNFPSLSFCHAPSLETSRLATIRGVLTTNISIISEQSGNDIPMPQLVISGDDGWIAQIAYLPDGRVVTGSPESGVIRVWNLQSGEGTPMEHDDKITSLAVTRDGTTIISSGDGGGIKVWDVESHKLVKAWTHRETSPVIAISPDNIAAGGRTVGIYTAEGEWVNSAKTGSFAACLSFSPDGNRLACGTQKDIRIYDVKTGTLVLGPLEDHDDEVIDMLWSRDGSRLFSASFDKTIRCWDSNTGEQIGQPWRGHTGIIYSLSLSPDGTLLASASFDQTVRFWDTTRGRPVGQGLQHYTEVYSVCFSPCGEFVASGVWDENIYLWRVPRPNSIQHRVITPFICGIFALIFIVSQVTPAFPGVRHPRSCSHSSLILCVAPSHAPSWNRICTTWLWSFLCEYSLNKAIV